MKISNFKFKHTNLSEYIQILSLVSNIKISQAYYIKRISKDIYILQKQKYAQKYWWFGALVLH